ncbi:MAG TPA: SPASM domain-containing protein, partial [Thermoanaerobaculia bacterium]|nr:SPASM domain-containing protein [Thermoanaerobaculia bacterium]
VIRIDEFRRITNIGSFERDITGDIAALTHRLANERRARGVVARAMTFFSRDESLADKLRHHLRMRRNLRADKQAANFDEACVIGWYSMLVRSSGMIAPCCILQHKPLGNIFTQPVADVWQGDAFANYREELTRIIRERDAWSAEGNKTLEPVCAVKGSDLCPMKSFYFARDVEFMRELDRTFSVIGDR